MSLISRLIDLRRHRVLGRVAKEALALYGVEFPAAVEVGTGLKVLHRGFGTVVHPSTRIGNNVTLFHGVTIGRGDPWVDGTESLARGVVIEDDVVLCAGAKIICINGVITVGRGTIVGANAVLTRSTGRNEVWAGVPARRIRELP
ncbi:serine O-acetyltransferase [Arthrobacter globiformis]|uniref:serine O-acetyltransferase n=1 Tax=Arthrobacter globiformis TaxID=1665 RepID=UPI001124D403|nr:serine acetyltransferase [Arthrobacter globiformis]